MVLKARLGLRVRCMAVSAAVVLLLVFILSHDVLAQRLLLTGAESLQDRLQPGARWNLWRLLWDAAWREPLAGYGWYQVSAAQQVAALDHPRSVAWTVHSHNLVIDLMVYVGAVPGLILAAIAALWYVRRLRACKDAQSWALIASVTALLVHALLEFPLHYAYFLLPAAVLVGAIEAVHKDDVTLAAPRSVVIATLASLVAACVWVAVEYAEVEEATRRAQLKEAGVVTPGFEPYVPEVTLLEGPRELLRLQLTAVREGMSSEDLEWIRVVRSRYAQPGALLRHAVAAGVNGQAADAGHSLALLCRIWPPRFCADARTRWAAYQQQHPPLRAVPFPEVRP